VDHSGSINIDEVFQTKKLVITEWGKRVFMAIDIDGSGCISFPEFYVGLWNYLAADPFFVQKMAFDMADEDGGGKLTVDEVRQLLILIHGKGANKKSSKELNKKVHTVMKALDNDKSGVVTFAEWQANAKSIQSIFKPALELQVRSGKSSHCPSCDFSFTPSAPFRHRAS